MIPVVFFRIGIGGPTELAIRTASAGNHVVLIGDLDRSYGRAVFHYYREFQEELETFSDANGEYDASNIDSICFMRWPAMLGFMRKYNYKHIMACDTDVLMFGNAGLEWEKIGSPDLTLSVCPTQRTFARPLVHAGHAIVSRDALDAFCARKVKEKDDMEAWANLVVDQGIPYVDTATPSGGGVWDHHLCSDVENYAHTGRVKHVEFIKGIPHITHNSIGQLRTPLLHCWEYSEPLMPRLAKQRNYQ